MRNTIIESIKATEVIVPSKPDSLNSDSVLDKDEAFAKKFLTGASWTEFAMQSKWIIEIELQNGLTGIGETYRSASKELIENAIKTFYRIRYSERSTGEGFLLLTKEFMKLLKPLYWMCRENFTCSRLPDIRWCIQRYC
jgi:hypothetical protein